MTLYVSLVVALLGILLYFFGAKPKFEEMGRIMFWVGLLSYLLKHATVLQ